MWKNIKNFLKAPINFIKKTNNTNEISDSGVLNKKQIPIIKQLKKFNNKN
jgi:hypothetical protein